MKMQYLEPLHGRLGKTFTKLANGSVQKKENEFPFILTSYEDEVTDLNSMCESLRTHAKAGHCLLRGPLLRPLIKESRRDLADKHARMPWICMDLDKVPLDCTPNAFLRELGFADVQHIVHWSSSHKLNPESLSYHIFMQLDRDIDHGTLKEWYQQINFEHSLLRPRLKLNKMGMSVSWPLDLTLADNTRLIFIADPVFVGMADPVGVKKRFELVTGTKSRLSIPKIINSPQRNDLLAKALLKDLQEKAGFVPIKHKTKVHKPSGTEVLAEPYKVNVTQVVDDPDRPWVYLNFNDGDSLGYYYLRKNPEVVHNFKGEPNYLLKDLDRGQYEHAMAEARIALNGVEQSHERQLLVLRDAPTKAYYHGEYIQADDVLRLDEAKDLSQVAAFCEQNNLPPYQMSVPIWRIEFDPPSTRPRIDVERKVINRFQTTVYMRNKSTRPVKAIPPTIEKVLRHLFPHDDAKGWECVERFVNWLAFLVQRRTTPHTAWMLYGTEGTGKGILAEKILTPLLGPTQVSNKLGSVLEDKFNDFMLGKLLLVFDEVYFHAMKDAEKIYAILRALITGNFVNIRGMHKGWDEAKHHAAVICMSNQDDALRLSDSDRRWNVSPYQNEKLVITQEEIDAIPGELQGFYNYLAHYAVDEKKAQTPYDSVDRNQLMANTQRPWEEVAAHIVGAKGARGANAGGDLGWLLDQVQWSNHTPAQNGYRLTLKALLDRTDRTTGECRIKRDEMISIFDANCTGVPDKSTGQTQMLQRALHMKAHKLSVDGKQTMCFEVKFNDVAKFDGYLAEHYAQTPAPEVKGRGKAKNNVIDLKGKTK